MTCIFCKKEYDNLSVEHVIPESIGGKLTYKCVCSSCNSKLGSTIDSLLCKEDVVLLLRHKFDIRSKTGESVDLTKEVPLYDEHGQKAIIGKGDGKTKPYRYNKAQIPEVKMNKGGLTSFKGGDSKAIQTAILRQAKKKGYQLDPNKIKTIVEGAKAEFKPELVHAEIRVNEINFMPCILKIAYEYAYQNLGENYLRDPCAENIHEFLWCFMNKDFECTASIDSWYGEFNLAYINVAKKKHVICMEANGAQVLVTIKLFDVLLFYVCVSNNAELYNIPSRLLYECEI